jgi:hypothetical protein
MAVQGSIILPASYEPWTLGFESMLRSTVVAATKREFDWGSYAIPSNLENSVVAPWYAAMRRDSRREARGPFPGFSCMKHRVH